MTHAEAVRMVRGKFANKTSRKLGNNTYARILSDGSVAIRYHETDVVTIHPDDTATLRTGGWKTYTTRARMDEYSPVLVYGKCQTRSWDSGDWTVRPKHGEWTVEFPFEEGMRVNRYMFV
jgi:hypothetical protein